MNKKKFNPFKLTSRPLFVLTVIFTILAITVVYIHNKVISEDGKLFVYVFFGIFLSMLFSYIIYGYTRLFVIYIHKKSVSNGFVYAYKNDAQFRGSFNLTMSALYAFIYAVLSYILGIINNSMFFAVVGGIYMLITLIKIYIVTTQNDLANPDNKIDRNVGYMIVAFGFFTIGSAVLVYFDVGAFLQQDLLIYAYSFYILFSAVNAIISFIKSRINHQGIVTRFMLVKLAAISFSIFTLTVPIVALFVETSPNSIKLYNLFIGLICGAFILIIGNVLIKHYYKSN